MTTGTELRSDTFTRWARATWPNIVGISGLGLIFFDCIMNPPPDTTSGIGILLVGATGFVKLNRAEDKHDRD